MLFLFLLLHLRFTKVEIPYEVGNERCLYIEIYLLNIFGPFLGLKGALSTDNTMLYMKAEHLILIFMAEYFFPLSKLFPSTQKEETNTITKTHLFLLMH